jgi:LysM repeat protein
LDYFRMVDTRLFRYLFSLSVALCMGISSLWAQLTPLIARQEGSQVFLNHKVQPKENWYSIGRIYNISPKEIAPYNNTSIEKGLSIGQIIRIPLNPEMNFAQSGTVAGDEVFIPVYHVVKEKEGLYRLSQTYYKVPQENLKAWNQLKSDELSLGSSVIVGYLIVKRALSPLAPEGVSKIGTVTKEPVVVKTTETKTAPKPVPVTEEKPETTTVIPTRKPNEDFINFNGGAFKETYNRQLGNKEALKYTGWAGIFKSTSGWQDGKYYALMNEVPSGTIIRVSLSNGGSAVYAKVLGELPTGKENEGLIIRLSNAAASELKLDSRTQKISVEINFVKE